MSPASVGYTGPLAFMFDERVKVNLRTYFFLHITETNFLKALLSNFVIPKRQCRIFVFVIAFTH